MKLGPYRLHVAWHAWEWGRDLFFFADTVLIHFGPFHLQRPMRAEDYLR